MTLFFTLLLSLLEYNVLGSTECSDASIYHVDWPLLTTLGDVPDFEYSITFDQFNLEVVIDANLTYLGYSVDGDNNELGTTYILDFESSDAHILPLDEPGTCSNRDGASYSGVDFSDWFSYSLSYPPVVGSTSYLAYPPSNSGDNWFIESYDCSEIHYKAHFSYKELYNECSNFAETEEYSVLSSDDEWINLTLTFYINIVSPLSSFTNTGFYRIYQLLSAPFVIAIHKTIEVLEPIGIRLFAMSIIAVYKENNQLDFRLIIVTETAEYLKLSDAQLVTYPWDLNTNPDIHFHVSDEFIDGVSGAIYDENPCLNNKAYMCSQIWEIYADTVPCPPTDFSGLYGMQFTGICNDDGSTNATVNAGRVTSCEIWLNTFENTIDLSSDLVWKDEVCDAKIWRVRFGAEMRYYSDSDYLFENEDNHLYKIGENERVSVEIEVIVPSGAYDVFAAELVNVWLCTTDPLFGEPPLDTTTGDGGCLSSDIDDDGPYHIVQNHDDVLLYNATHDNDIDPDQAPNVVRFSFIPPISIRRDTLYIHAQLTLNLVNSRRRMMSNHDDDDDKTYQIKHFMDVIETDPTQSQPYQHIKEIEEYKKKNGFYDEMKQNMDHHNVIEELNGDHNKRHDPFGDDNVMLNDKGPYIALAGNAYYTFKVICVFIGFLLFVNVCCLMYSSYYKHRDQNYIYFDQSQ